MGEETSGFELADDLALKILDATGFRFGRGESGMAHVEPTDGVTEPEPFREIGGLDHGIGRGNLDKIRFTLNGIQLYAAESIAIKIIVGTQQGEGFQGLALIHRYAGIDRAAVGVDEGQPRGDGKPTVPDRVQAVSEGIRFTGLAAGVGAGPPKDNGGPSDESGIGKMII